IKVNEEYTLLYLSNINITTNNINITTNNINITTNNYSQVVKYEDGTNENTQSTQIKKDYLKDGYHFPKHLCNSESFNESKMDAVFKGSIMPIYKHQLGYCRVYKGGSTFWRRLLYCLDKDLKVSPFSIKPQDENRKYRRTYAINSLNWIYNMLRVKKSFMFTRNPYSRILSAYIDKLFSPNPYFWKTLGVNIMKTIRKRTSCGSDVTFRDLVEYITQTPIEHLDDHFIPISSICRPCKVQYSYIGKMEYFLNDTLNIFNKFGINSTYYITHNFSELYEYDAIYDTVQAVIAFRQQSDGCMNRYTGLNRIWRKLQTRGIISENYFLPLNKKESQNISSSQLMTLILKTNKISKKEDLLLQKRKMFVDAYNTIPIDTMYKLQTVYKNDFKLFGYDAFPDSLFGQRSKIKTDMFMP
ncbi:chondroitin 4-sulfotransferase 11, partial [Mytilus galloprovincialis]